MFVTHMCISRVTQDLSSVLQGQHMYVLYSTEICPKPEACPEEVLMSPDVRECVTVG